MAPARAAEAEERSRLWARWQEINESLDAYAALRSSETAVVVLEPQSTPTRALRACVAAGDGLRSGNREITQARRYVTTDVPRAERA